MRQEKVRPDRCKAGRGRSRGNDPVGLLMATRDQGDSWEDLGVKLPPVIGLWAAADE